MKHKEAEYYEEFSLEGKSIIYIDFSHARSDEEFFTAFEKIEHAIAGYPECSIYTITNMAGVKIDTLYKDNFIKYGKHNKPYVKKAVIIGLDGVKKMIVASIFKTVGRGEFPVAFTKEKAIEWILQQD